MSVSMAGLKNSEIVIGEGITEVYYLDSLRDILLTRPKAKELRPYNMEELEKAIKYYADEGRTAIHCLIDMDNKVNNVSNMQKYQRLKQKYDGKIVKKTECTVRFYESYPSIETFFYFYFDGSTSEKSNNELKSWLNHRCGYETKARYAFHKAFVNNGGCLKSAIINAKNSVRLRADGSYNCKYSEMGDFIEHLGVIDTVNK